MPSETDRKLKDALIAPQTPIQLIGEMAELYTRFGRAAIELRRTCDAHMRAQDEYKQALALWTAACERAVKAEDGAA
jgi:hypothetical protein